MTSGHHYYLVIVGRFDKPLFEMDHSTRGSKREVDHRYLTQFVAHTALDLVDEYIWTTSHMYLKCVDKFNEWFVTAFVGGNSRVRLLLLHDATRIDEQCIKNFFYELYDLYTKFALNPLYAHHTEIKSKNFEKKALILAKKYLP